MAAEIRDAADADSAAMLRLNAESEHFIIGGSPAATQSFCTSMRFHRRFGFRAVGSQQTANGKKTVSLQEVTLSRPDAAPVPYQSAG
jgi:predicted GNAT superfamily acetyltransferase